MPRTIVFNNKEIIENKDIELLLKSTGIEEYYFKKLETNYPQFIKENGFGYKKFLISVQNLGELGIVLNDLSFKVAEQENDLLFFSIEMNRYRQTKWLLKNNFKLQDDHLEILAYYKNDKRLLSLNKYITQLLLKNIKVVNEEKWISYLIQQKEMDNLYSLYINNKDLFSTENINKIISLKDKNISLILEKDVLRNMLDMQKISKNRL